MAENRLSGIRNGIAIGLAFALLGGCGEDSAESPAQPVNGSQPPAAFPPSNTPSTSMGTRQISGEVFAALGPVVGAGIVIWVQSPVYGWYWHRNALLVSDTAGHFTATGIENDAKLIIRVIDDAYKQPCVASIDAGASASVRVEVIPVGAFDAIEAPRPSTTRNPSLAGTVYRGTVTDKAPVSSAEVRIENEAAIPIATTLTDREGHYFFCNLPAQVVLGASKLGYYNTTLRPVDTTTGVPVDIYVRLDDF